MKAPDNAQARMNQMYRHQRRIYDVTRRYYLLGRISLIGKLAPPSGGSVLEIGCGTASNLIAIAARYPDARLFGFDISTEMLATAAQSVARQGAANRIALSTGDATQFDGTVMFGQSGFDRIVTSYTLSMIHDWPRVLDEAARHLRPGGSIHIVDFGDCARLPRWVKRGLYSWLNTFNVTPRQDLEGQLLSFAARNGLDLMHTPLFAGYAQYAVLTRQ